MTAADGGHEERVLLLAPTPKDSAMTRQVFAGVGVNCTPCATAEALATEIAAGAGAVVLTEHAITLRDINVLTDLLRQQPPWSDLPVVVLVSGGANSLAGRTAFDLFGNVTVLERPVQMASLASVVRTLIRSRRRQYQMREHLRERERVAEVLRQSDERLRMALTAARMVVWELDPATGRAVVLENAVAVFGLPPDTTLDTTDHGFALVHPDDVARHRETFARSIAECSGHFTQFRMMRRDNGAVIWIEERAHAVCDPTGKAVRLVGVMVDITERKGAEAAIQRAKDDAERDLARWQAVVEHMTEGLVLAGPDGELLSMNPAALAMHGFSSVAEMFRRLGNYRNLFELRDTAGRVLKLEEWPLPRAVRGERFTGYEVQVHQRDTGRTWTGSYGGTAVRDAAGAVRLAVLTVRDITEQRRAEAAVAENEARFRQLAETIPQLAWMANADGWIFWYNRRWHEYTGTTPAQMEGWGWQTVHDPEQLPAVVERWQHSIRTGQPFEMEFPLKGADGRFRWFLTRVAPLRDSDGTLRMWFGTNTDVEDARQLADERARLLEAERAARGEAERVGRVKDEFLATLSHELRTPLNAILGWSQLLAAGGARNEEDLAEGLRTIERNARAQTQIIEDLLDMSRIINGKVRLDVQRIELEPVLHAALDTVRPAADAKEIRVHKVLDPLAGFVSGDPNRLQQVFWNLLSNAIKFTPKGGRVQVLLERVNSHLEVSVIDSGEGIAPEFLPHVFDRFRQADASTSRRHGGLGLGLAIVKQLVELHGGTIRARSPGAGQGSTFVVTLPLTVIHPEQEPEPRRRHPKAAPPVLPRSGECVTLDGLKVLVVDDEPDARALVKKLLADCRATVVTASSAAEALEAVRAGPPDVIVSDIGMPGEDGYSLIRRVRALGRDGGGETPAVALTAYARSEDRVKAMQYGFQMHVAKPVEPAELVMVVAALARRAAPPGGPESAASAG